MKALVIATLLAIFPAYSQACLDHKYAKQSYKELSKVMAKALEEKEEDLKITIDKNTKIFLDGKQIDKMPSPEGIVVTKLVLDENNLVLEIHFETAK